MNNIEMKLNSLQKSKFRNSFHLKASDKLYIKEKGIITIKEHAASFIKKNLAPIYIKNDGKQTPFHGHPVFIAMHACACCCRKCLEKWHGIPRGRELTKNEQNYILILLLFWIRREYKK